MSDPLPAVNLYEMYVANEMQVGFWVKRRTWGALCARVTFVGEIERHGRWCGGGPVRADIFHFVLGTLKEADVVLPSPGSRTAWQQIPPPPLHAWSRRPGRSYPLTTMLAVQGATRAETTPAKMFAGLRTKTG